MATQAPGFSPASPCVLATAKDRFGPTRLTPSSDTYDWSGLGNVERLAGRHIRQVIDDDDAGDEIESGELTRERAADLAGSKDDDRGHGDIL